MASLSVFDAMPSKRGLAQVEPWLVPIRRGSEDRDLMMRSQCGYLLACPAIAMAGEKTIPVEDASDQIIIGKEDQLPHSSDDIGRGAVALPAAAARQAQFGMDATSPMDHEDDLACLGVDIGDHLMDDGAHDALFETCVCRRR